MRRLGMVLGLGAGLALFGVIAPALAQKRFPSSAGALAVETVAGGLEHPWGLAFLPDGRMLVTERPGRLRIVDAKGDLSRPISGVPSVMARGQGGLLGIALDPDFARNRLVYLSFAEPRSGGNGTSVARGRLNEQGTALTEARVIFRQMPTVASNLHFGSRLVFDRTGALFVTVGERFTQRDQAQNPDNDLGKIIRIRPDGGIPADNPKKPGWAPEIWSIGHRNVQGAALHPETGQLWTAEHGARGGDEINLPLPGRNYGWPVATYGMNYSGLPIPESRGTEAEGTEQPLYYWRKSPAVSGMAFYDADRHPQWRGSLFIGSLVEQQLIRLSLDGERIAAEERLLSDRGERIRDVRAGPDGGLYVLTDSPEGKLLRVSPR